MLDSTIHLFKTFFREGQMIKLRLLLVLLSAFFLLTSCSSGPSDKEIISALKTDFTKNGVPECISHGINGGGMFPDSLQIEILKKGALVKESPQAFMPGNYYPARVRVKGKGWHFNPALLRKENHQFDCTIDLQMRKGDYKEWQADYDPINGTSRR